MELTDSICVQCDFTNFMRTSVVLTTHGEVMNILNNGRDLSLYKGMMRSALRNLIKYNQKEFDIIFNEKGQDWKNWCNDLVLYQCYRLKVTGQSILIR